MDPFAAFNPLANPNPTALQGIAKLLLSDNLEIVWALFTSADVTELESIASTIVKFFEENERGMVLMKQAISRELQNTLHSSTLFRQNNYTSKLLSAYSKRYGLPYIKYILDDIINFVCLSRQRNPDWSCEIEESKMQPDQLHLRENNLTNLLELSARLIDRIVTSVNVMPPTMRELCFYLKSETEQKFTGEYPRTVFASVGGFIFLRFICPALAIPHKFGILEVAPGKVITRDLTLLSKVLQNIANGVPFSSKDPFLEPINLFLEENQNRVLEFLDALAAPENNTDIELKDFINSFSMTTPRGSVCQQQPFDDYSRVPGRRASIATERPRSFVLSSLFPSASDFNIALESHTFSYRELMGIIQYLGLYWKPLKVNLVKMDKNNGTVYSEIYIQLSVLLEQLGVIPHEVIDQLTKLDGKNRKKKKSKRFRGLRLFRSNSSLPSNK